MAAHRHHRMRSLAAIILPRLLGVQHASAQWPERHRADSLFKAGDLTGMLQEDLHALEMAQRGGNAWTLAWATLRVGIAHHFLLNRDEAMRWLRRSATLAQQAGADTLAAKAWRSIGAIHQEQDRPDSAQHWLGLAERVMVRQDDPRELAYLYAILFELHFRDHKDVGRAHEMVALGEQHARRSSDPAHIAFVLMKKGALLAETGRCEESLDVLRKGEALYREDGRIEGVTYALITIAAAQSACGMAEASISTIRGYAQLRDSLFNARTADRVAHYQAVFDTQRREIENLRLHQRNQWLLLTGVVGTLLAAFISYAVYRRREARRRHLHQEQLRMEQRRRHLDVVQAQEAERTRIAADLHDGVGHLLGALKLNTSVLHGRDEREQDILHRSRGMIDDAAREVRSMSHRLMPRSLEELGLVPALRELASRVGGSVQASVECDRQEYALDGAASIALYRIAQEAVSNALKHAQARHITVRVAQEGNVLRMTVSDDGRGFDTTATGTSGGIGQRTIHSRAELVGGTLDVHSRIGEGTTVRVEVPVEP